MATVVGDSELVRIGPGAIYVAPYTTPLPVDVNETLDAAFRQVGFTVDGSELTYSQTSDGVTVAERLRPIRSIITGVDMTFTFTMAEISPENLAMAMNADPSTAIVTAGDTVTFKWPKSGGVSRVSIVWESDEPTPVERLVLAKCFAGGDITIPRRKGVDPAAVGVTFTIEENSDTSLIGGDDARYLANTSLFV